MKRKTYHTLPEVVLGNIPVLDVPEIKIRYNRSSRKNFLGKISYGLYMYHFMIIPIILYILNKYKFTTNEFYLNFIIYFTTILITILVSAFSYYFFENKFIKLKSKFSPIKSSIPNE